MRAVFVLAMLGCGRFDFDPSRDGGAASDAPNGSDAAPGDGPAIGSGAVFVQHRALGFGMSTTGTVMFPSPVTAGDLLVVVTDTASLTVVPTISDSLGNTWTQYGPFDGFCRLTYAVAVASSSGLDSVTTTVTAPSAFYELRMFEYANVSALEHDSGADGNAAVGELISLSAETDLPNDLVFAMFIFETSGTGAAGPGYTIRDNVSGDVGEEAIFPVPGSHVATATFPMGVNWVALALTLSSL